MPNLSSPPESLALYETDAVKEMLDYAVEHENRIHSHARITVVDLSELEPYIKDHSTESRYRVIVNYNNHFTAVDVRQSEKGNSCIILDSCNDIRFYATYVRFLENGFSNPLVPSGMSYDPCRNLQSDLYSCSLFAFDHAVQLSNASDDFHDVLNETIKDGPLRWDSLPPNFIWNVQSMKVLHAYKAAIERDNPDLLDEKMPCGLSFREYISQGVCSYDIDGVLVTRNESINANVFGAIKNNWLAEQNTSESTLESPATQQDVKAALQAMIAEHLNVNEQDDDEDPHQLSQ